VGAATLVPAPTGRYPFPAQDASAVRCAAPAPGLPEEADAV